METKRRSAPVLTCTHVIYGWSPVLHASYRADDGALQLLCSTHPHDGQDYRLLPLQVLMLRDRSLAQVASLPRGTSAFRTGRAEAWLKEPAAETLAS